MNPTTIQPSHLNRLAVVYVRQSTPLQVEQNSESRRRPPARGGPAASVNLDELDADWRPLAEVMLDADDRGAALEAALAQRSDGNQRWAELLAADALAPGSDSEDRPKRFRLVTPRG
jgi:hypothetical protein